MGPGNRLVELDRLDREEEWVTPRDVPMPARVARSTLQHERIEPPSASWTPYAWVAFGAALLLWLSSLPFFDLDRMSGFGLLNAVPLTWMLSAYVAFVIYVVAAASGRVANAALWGLHLVVVLILYGTTTLLYEQPRYTWMYKHVGVVEYILANNSIDRSIDVYHNWPGFFVVVAALSKVTGLDPLTLSRWSEVFFGLALAVALHYAVRALTRDRRVAWTAVALFTITNWIGQGYFAPQALATLLTFVFFGAALRVLGRGGIQPRSLVQRALARLGVEASPLAVVSNRRVDAVVALAAFAGLVATHQLNPPAVLLQLAVLATLVRVRALWLLVVPVVLEVAWLGLVARVYIAEHLELLSFNVSENVDVPGDGLVASLPGLAVAQWSGPALMSAVMLLAAAGTVLRLRRGWIDLPAVALAAGPVLIVALNSYGSEALFRIYLYALPWACFLAAGFVVGPDRLDKPTPGPRHQPDVVDPAVRPPVTNGLLARQYLVCLAIVPLTLTANFFLERINVVSDDDVMIATWFDENTEPDAYAMLVAPNYPTRITHRYPDHIIQDGAFAPAVTSWMDEFGRAEYAVDAADELFDIFDWRPGYLVFSPSQRRYAQAWGLLPGAEYDRFRQLVAASPDYEVVFEHGSGLVARYVGIHAPSATSP